MLSSVNDVYYPLGVDHSAENSTNAAIQQLAGLLMSATEHMTASFEAACARRDLTPQQARALLGLKEKAPMRVLAQHMCCDPSNITGIADRLEARGLVRREAPQSDRRVKLLALTEKGETIREALERSIFGESPIVTHLTPQEREQLAGLLEKVVAVNQALSGSESDAAEDNSVASELER